MTGGGGVIGDRVVYTYNLLKETNFSVVSPPVTLKAKLLAENHSDLSMPKSMPRARKGGDPTGTGVGRNFDQILAQLSLRPKEELKRTMKCLPRPLQQGAL